MSEQASLLSDPIVWYTASLILFFVVIYRFARKPIVGGLDAEIAKIRTELEEAKRLRAEAAATLVDYRARQQAAMAEVDKIIAHAKEEAARLRANAEAELKTALERHEQKAAERIRMAEAEAVAEVRAAVIDEALATARTALAAHLDAAAATRLADQAIAEVPELAKNKVA